MNLPLALSSGLVTIAILGIIITLTIIFYRKNTGESFSFFNRFPFEILQVLTPVERRMFQIPLLILGVAVPTFFFGAFFANGIFITYIILAISVFFALGFIFLFYVKTTVVERHVLIASFVMFLALLLDLFIAYYSFITPFNQTYSEILKFGSLALALAQLLLMLNPKLKTWGQLEKVASEGTSSFIRPRIFILPLSEWLTLLNIIILEIIVVISIVI